MKYPKKTMFNRVHTIKEAVDKFEDDNVGKATLRNVQPGLRASVAAEERIVPKQGAEGAAKIS